MANMFSRIIRSIFGNKSNGEVLPRNDINDNDDDNQYIDLDLLMKNEFIHLESAYQNQEYVFRRATEYNRFVLGELLEQILKVIGVR